MASNKPLLIHYIFQSTKAFPFVHIQQEKVRHCSGVENVWLIKLEKNEHRQHLHKGIEGQESQLSQAQRQTCNLLNIQWKLLNHIYNLNYQCLYNNKWGTELTQNSRKVTNLRKYKKID
jgi:hypothetical protein